MLSAAVIKETNFGWINEAAIAVVKNQHLAKPEFYRPDILNDCSRLGWLTYQVKDWFVKMRS
jgi:hypothetical protein